MIDADDAVIGTPGVATQPADGEQYPVITAHIASVATPRTTSECDRLAISLCCSGFTWNYPLRFYILKNLYSLL